MNDRTRTNDPKDHEQRVDVVVLGGGPGGYSAAFHAAHAGFSTALVCDEPLGGVCLHRGCIPSKALLELAELRHRVAEAEAHGLRWGEPTIDRAAIGAYRNTMIDHLADGLEDLCRRRRVQRWHGRGRFTATDRLAVATDEDTRHLRFGHAIIATGSRPSIPPPLVDVDDPRVIDAAGALALDAIPRRLAVLGAGYVGLEMASVYAALGSAVSVIEMRDRILDGVDADLVAPLERRLRARLRDVHLGTTLTEIDTGGDALEVGVAAGDRHDRVTADRLLVATGRRPNSDDIGLDALGIATDESGRIAVDHQGRTAAERVFAVGDVATDLPLAHVAMHEGRIAAESIAGAAASRAHRARPAVVYTDPQIAWCGLTETDAAAAGRPVRILRNRWQSNGRAYSLGSTDGITKLVCDPDTGRVLGMGIVGRHAESLIGEGLLAVELAATVDDLALIMHPHPTVVEPAHEAAAGARGVALHGG